VPPGGQHLAEPGHLGVGGDLAGIDEQRRFPATLTAGAGSWRPPARITSSLIAIRPLSFLILIGRFATLES
jgi:hypothetical protein